MQIISGGTAQLRRPKPPFFQRQQIYGPSASGAGAITAKYWRQVLVESMVNGLCWLGPHHKSCGTAICRYFCSHSITCFSVFSGSQVLCSNSISSFLVDALCYDILLETQCLRQSPFQRSAAFDLLLPSATARNQVPQFMRVRRNSMFGHIVTWESATGGILGQGHSPLPCTTC